eukprot:COSAG02_NODE_33545_length_498_cov_1.030075_1_plen_127_part_10
MEGKRGWGWKLLSPCGERGSGMMGAGQERLLRAVLFVGLQGWASAQCTGFSTKTTVAGYDYSGLTETDLAYSGSTFDVTGIKCADGFATAAGSSVAVVTKCSSDNTAYTVSGCLPCTSGVGLCTETS